MQILAEGAAFGCEDRVACRRLFPHSGFMVNHPEQALKRGESLCRTHVRG